MKKLPSAKPIIKNHLERTLRVAWKNVLVDPRRENHHKRWHFGYMMDVLFFGLLSGAKNLREVETLSECYDERLPDTTLHDVMVQLDPQPVRALITREVKAALRSHELPRDEFPVRITAIDGKWISISDKKLNRMSSKFHCDFVEKYSHVVLRALHSSNTTKVFLGQKEIPTGFGENTMVGQFIDALERDYGKTDLLEVYSFDAGFTNKMTASHVVSYGRDYIMALKSNQQVLLQSAQELLTEVVCVTEEKQSGKTITRKLFRSKASGSNNHGWGHIAEFWRIRKTVVRNKDKKKSTEDHYYLSSIDSDTLTDKQVLQAVRMHWSIENNGNWHCDTAWDEDNAPFANRALELVSLMRLFAYNIMARLMTRRLRKANARKLSWAGAMQIIRSLIIQIRCDSSLTQFLSPAFVR